MKFAFYSKFALRFFKVSFKQGDLTLLFLTLILSLMMMLGLTIFIDRVQLMLQGQSREFMAADKVLVSPSPVDAGWLKEAKRLNLKVAEVMRFRSMIYIDDEPTLVSVKAVSEAYPLLGQVSSKKTLTADTELSAGGPQIGELWLGARLYYSAKADTGIEAELGNARLLASRVLIGEPDAGSAAFSFAPKVLMRIEDVEKTGVVQFGSRITYRYLFSGSRQALNQFESYLTPLLDEHVQFEALDKAQPGVARALAKAETFLQLAVSIILLLACFALGVTSLRFSKRQFKQVAVLKTLGLTKADLTGIFGTLLLIVLLLALLIGGLLGFGLQALLTLEVASHLSLIPEQSEAVVWVLPFVLVTLCYLGFAALPVLQVRHFSPVGIFRQLSSSTLTPTKKQGLVALGLLLLVLFLVNGQWAVSLFLLSGLLVGLLSLVVPFYWVFKSITGKKVSGSPLTLLVMNNFRRHLSVNALVVSVFACSFLLVFVLVGAQQGLLQNWRNQLPANTPNVFMINIQPDETAIVLDWLARLSHDVGDKPLPLYPMVRGRLININGQKINETVSKEAQNDAGINRELNLSWTDTLPIDNKLVAGQWFDAKIEGVTLPAVSVESKLAKKLDIALGDQLGFSIDGETLTTVVTSLREVDWDNMHPNFYMLFEPGTLDNFHATYMTSSFIPEADRNRLGELLKEVPTLVLFDVDAVIAQIRNIVDQVSIVLFLIVIFVLITCLFVLSATIQASLDERIKESALIRAIGGRFRLISLSLILEFVTLGLVAGLSGCLFGELVLYVLQWKVLDLAPAMHPWLWVAIPLSASLMMALAGLLSTLKVTQSNPVSLLRVS